MLQIHSFLHYNSPGAGAVLFLKGRSRSCNWGYAFVQNHKEKCKIFLRHSVTWILNCGLDFCSGPERLCSEDPEICFCFSLCPGNLDEDPQMKDFWILIFYYGLHDLGSLCFEQLQPDYESEGFWRTNIEVMMKNQNQSFRARTKKITKFRLRLRLLVNCKAANYEFATTKKNDFLP